MTDRVRRAVHAARLVVRDVTAGTATLYSNWLVRRPVHAALLGVQVAGASGLIGVGFGVGNLYWHEQPLVQFAAGVCVGGFALLVWWLAVRLEPDHYSVYAVPAERVCGRLARLKPLPHPERMLLALYFPLVLVLFGLAAFRSFGGEGRWWENLWLLAGVCLVALIVCWVARRMAWPRPRMRSRTALVGFLVTFVLMQIGAWVVPVTAVMALSLLLAALAWLAAALAGRPLMSLVVVAAVVLGVGLLNGGNPYKLTYPGMDYNVTVPISPYTHVKWQSDVDVEIEVRFWDACKDNPPGRRASVDSEKQLVHDKEAIRAWRLASGSDKKPVLVVVAASGGGIAASYFTASCLSELERQCPEFTQRIRIITGASGGMYGAAVFAARAGTGDTIGPGVVVDCGKDSLTPMIRQLFLADLPSVFAPYQLRFDRGRTLEATWAANTGGTTDRPLFELLDGEATGTRPSLIFSPMQVEDGRQILISNLDVSRLSNGGQFFDIFPGSRKSLTIGTAIRMNAAFPYASPAVSLPTNPPIRLVDAGYRDNYGVELATAWIEKNRDCLIENTSGVLLLQLRTFPRLTVNQAKRLGDRISLGWEFVRSPMEGLTSVRLAAMDERNNRQIDLVLEKFSGDQPEPFFRTIEIEGTEDIDSVPLGWSLTAVDRRRLDKAIASAANVEKFAEVVKFVRR